MMRDIMKICLVMTMLSAVAVFTSCEHSYVPDIQNSDYEGTVFRLRPAGYSGPETRSGQDSGMRYDRLYYHITDGHGSVVRNLKSWYDPSSSEIHVEGLHEGSYALIVLGIVGNESDDNAVVNELSDSNDPWLVFPEDMDRPLRAEYFYSQTPFKVTETMTPEGVRHEISSIPEYIRQERIISRVDFSFSYANRYVSNAVVSKSLSLDSPRFHTTLSGNGEYSGSTDGSLTRISLDSSTSYCFMPLSEGSDFSGEISLKTVNYMDETAAQSYRFRIGSIGPNHIHPVVTEVRHPDDMLATMYVTADALGKGDLSFILQDTETKDVYTDRSQRSFNTAKPLQIAITDDGRLHLRFYSPKQLDDVLIRARIPSVSDEYVDLAYFSHIPPFADFYEGIPVTERTVMFRTESGKYIEVQRKQVQELTGAEFRIESGSEYWAKLQKIEHGWNIFWGLFGGNPDLPDGGPVGNWMGIRPVHCRESVAFFLNFTYMIDMPEHEQILRDNADKLYDDNKQPVKVEEVLAKMRRNQTLQVGLVYPGNGVVGLGSPTVFGAYQGGWFEHYRNTYACNVMFHELGHVMGYGHNSSFTYGPWAEQLMNNFYVNNIKDFPIGSSSYLDSANNPHKYL